MYSCLSYILNSSYLILLILFILVHLTNSCPSTRERVLQALNSLKLLRLPCLYNLDTFFKSKCVTRRGKTTCTLMQVVAGRETQEVRRWLTRQELDSSTDCQIWLKAPLPRLRTLLTVELFTRLASTCHARLSLVLNWRFEWMDQCLETM